MHIITLVPDKYKSEAVILTTTLCSLHAACTSEKAQKSDSSKEKFIPDIRNK